MFDLRRPAVVFAGTWLLSFLAHDVMGWQSSITKNLNAAAFAAAATIVVDQLI